MQLILPATIVLQLQNELRRAGRREIGGLLLAEHLHDEAFRLAEVTVQRTGGSAVHFVRDPALNQKQLDQFFEKTGDYTRFNYLGEWHSHPSFEPRPSFKDIRTMQSIVEDPAVGVNFLVLLIVTRMGPREIRTSAMVFQANAKPREVELQVEKSPEKPRAWLSGVLTKIFFRK